MSAVRSRPFIFPLLHGVCDHFLKYFVSTSQIDILSTLWSCTSYKEALLCESCNALHYQTSVSPSEEECFIQYVADNADYNVAKIDGLNIFNSMGNSRYVAPDDRIYNSVPSSKVSDN